MNDIESMVVDKITKVLTAQFPSLGIDIASEYVMSPERFPHVSIVMSDSYTNENTYLCETPEYSTVVNFQINVYSNLVAGKKTQVKQIMTVIDFALQAMGFVRTALTPVPNYLDSTVYRVTGNYRGYVTQDNSIYRR